MKKLELTGNAKAIGYKHGQEGKDQVLKSLETYERLFHGYQQIDWSTVKERAKIHIPAIERYDETMLTEMQGIAAGAGVDFEDILALNARSEIALTGQSHTSFADGCTSIGMAPPYTEHTIIGQNWDWKGEQRDSLLQLHIEQHGRPTIAMVTEGGIIGKIGMNSSSVAVGLNALITDRKTDGVPIHLGLRAVLNASSLSESLAAVQEGQLASSANFLIGASEGTSTGMALQVEVSPYGAFITNEDASIGVHTNHLCAEHLKIHVNDHNNFRLSDSEIRKRRAEQLIRTAQRQGTPLTEETMKDWLQDTFNAPNAINHYVNLNAPTHRQMETVFSIVMNVTKQRLHICDGMPIEKPYEEYGVTVKEEVE
ncbi:C45 family autoproteolytic acyltransferase/hydrolase [Marinococcus halophilus]|uniref:Acyl-CoA--6-aminopenicillanic acid acyl-transferase n=1 Tax=Marinococcus halophilus TaxID=1371 RepID=A0A510Y9V0_MARHA|nr:C45 family peptidase [Marinococcus halophilus]GEK59923.1 acyl-CoA--6-aminopenicillanic acid acyl-transferase [Marinococcus halophilus]